MVSLLLAFVLAFSSSFSLATCNFSFNSSFSCNNCVVARSISRCWSSDFASASSMRASASLRAFEDNKYVSSICALNESMFILSFESVFSFALISASCDCSCAVIAASSVLRAVFASIILSSRTVISALCFSARSRDC